MSNIFCQYLTDCLRQSVASPSWSPWRQTDTTDRATNGALPCPADAPGRTATSCSSPFRTRWFPCWREGGVSQLSDYSRKMMERIMMQKIPTEDFRREAIRCVSVSCSESNNNWQVTLHAFPIKEKNHFYYLIVFAIMRFALNWIEEKRYENIYRYIYIEWWELTTITDSNTQTDTQLFIAHKKFIIFYFIMCWVVGRSESAHSTNTTHDNNAIDCM